MRADTYIVSARLKAAHDLLMAEKPAGAKHDPATCPVCLVDAVTTGGTTANERTGGGSSVTTYSEEELQAKLAEAVSKATADMKAELDKFQSQTAEQQLTEAIAKATAEKDGQLAELQTKLDAATVEAAAEKKAREDLEAFLENAKAEAEAKVEADARKDARIEEIKAAELALSDKWISENADRLAAMSDEDWSAQLESWKEIAGKAGESTIPDKTALHAGREGAGDVSTGRKTNGFAVADGTLREMHSSRALDPRTL